MAKPATEPQRIQYFDLAKGICILLVLWFHLKESQHIHSVTDVYLDAVRMPLYFFLSGFFFKTYGGFRAFLGKKAMKLMVPFAFFYLTTSVLLPILAHRFLGMEFSTGQDWHLIYAFLTYSPFPNIPLWFLWGLFVLNLTFYAVKRFVRSDLAISLCCLVLGALLGYAFNLPASLSATFRGLIFFYLGYIFHKHDIVERMKLQYAIPAAATAFLALGFIVPGNPVALAIVRVLTSMAGITLLVLVCRTIGRLPYVSYVGRYSIMLLVTHEPLIRLLLMLHIDNILMSFVLIAASYLAIIPFMRKYMPCVTAQR